MFLLKKYQKGLPVGKIGNITVVKIVKALQRIRVYPGQLIFLESLTN